MGNNCCTGIEKERRILNHVDSKCNAPTQLEIN